jgi:hypothetical protein
MQNRNSCFAEKFKKSFDLLQQYLALVIPLIKKHGKIVDLIAL